jgi:hypothetical membrane protein
MESTKWIAIILGVIGIVFAIIGSDNNPASLSACIFIVSILLIGLGVFTRPTQE